MYSRCEEEGSFFSYLLRKIIGDMYTYTYVLQTKTDPLLLFLKVTSHKLHYISLKVVRVL
jgi:hypothetical protein